MKGAFITTKICINSYVKYITGIYANLSKSFTSSQLGILSVYLDSTKYISLHYCNNIIVRYGISSEEDVMKHDFWIARVVISRGLVAPYIHDYKPLEPSKIATMK